MAFSVQNTTAGSQHTPEREVVFTGKPALPTDVLLDVPPLPLCFVGDDAHDAWVAVLGSRKRVNELAEKLRKVKIRSSWASRKQMKIQEDAHVLSVCFSEPDLQAQLSKQLPPQQLHQFHPMSITKSFLDDLVGQEQIKQHQSVLNRDDMGSLQAAICERFPPARHAFSFGWSDSIHFPLVVLPDVLGLIEEEQGERYYQACFAAYACMLELIDTHVPLAQMGATDKVGDALNGVLAYKLSMEKKRWAEGLLPLMSASSLRGALGAQIRRLDEDWSDPTELLHVMESLRGVWGDGKTGFTTAAEEIGNAYLLPKLKEMFGRVVKAEGEAFQGERNELGTWPRVDKFKLQGQTGPLTDVHVAVLSPLWSEFDYATYFRELETQVATVEERSRRIVQGRANILGLSQKTLLDVEAISSEASLVSSGIHEIKLLIEKAGRKLAGPFEMLSSVMASWMKLLKVAPLDSNQLRREDDNRILELAQQEISTLNAELKRLKRDTHHGRGTTVQLAVDHGLANEGVAQIPTAIVRRLINDPERLTPTEILSFISTLARDRVKILPSAWRSAKESERFEYSARMLELMDKLVFDYLDAIKRGRPDSDARNILGSAYSAKESETVSLVPSMRAQRTFQVDGEPLFFERHLGIGRCTGSARGMRIYFEIVEGVIVIGYCGKHLTVVSTN